MPATPPPPPFRRSRFSRLSLETRRRLAVAGGGAAGGGLRLLIGDLLGDPGLGFPWPTLIVNLLGALGLGLLLPRLLAAARSGAVLQPLLAVGFLGSFTTFSGLVVEVTLLADARRAALAAGYAALSVTAGLLVAFVGLRWGRKPA